MKSFSKSKVAIARNDWSEGEFLRSISIKISSERSIGLVSRLDDSRPPTPKAARYRTGFRAHGSHGFENLQAGRPFA
jgi:hypothetical protein